MRITETRLNKHYTSPRRGRVQFVVVHHMTIIGNGKGSANDACYRVWQTRQASAHYGVDGSSIRRFVRDSDAAWATGDTTGNHSGISIEHANSTAAPHWRISETTWKNGARLAAKLHVDHKLGRPASTNGGRGGTLRKHSSFTSTACPGPFMDSIWGQYVAEAQREYDRLAGKAAKPVSHRIGSWNVALIVKRPKLGDRVRRIRAKVKKVRLDVLGVQEAPSSGDGRHIKTTLIGRDGKPMKRVGAKARYIFLRSDATVHGAATWNPWPKNKRVAAKFVTTACATIDGHKRFYVNCHPISGAKYAKHRELHAKATIVKSIRRAKKQGLGREDIVFMGDFNGPEFARVAERYGFVRVRKHAKTVGSIVRTYQGFGKRKRTDAGGQYDYILVHKSKAGVITRARTFWTWKASDHNLTIAEIKEV